MPYSYNRYSSDSYGSSSSSSYGVKDILGGRTSSYDPSAHRSRPSYSFSSDLERTKSEDFRPATRYTDGLRDLDSQLKSFKLSSSTPSYTSTSSSHYLRRPSMGSTASSNLASSGLHNRYTSSTSVTSTLPSLSPSSGTYNSSKYGASSSSSSSRYGVGSSRTSLIPVSGQASGRSRTTSGTHTTSSIRTITGDLTERDSLSKRKRGGLKNIGNSCYLNSVLQCLLHCAPMQSYLTKGGYESEINSRSKTSGKVAKYAAQLFEDLLSGSTGNPTLVKGAVSKASGLFRGTAQEDAQEFLRWFLEALHDDVCRIVSKPRITQEAKTASEAWRFYKSREDSSIVDMCVGQLKSSLTCSVCSYVSEVWDPFWDLSLPIPSLARGIDDCLKEFQREEILDGSEQPKCEKCKKRRKMSKKFSIEKYPQLLVIHLKRFGDSTGYSRRKITTDIRFPEIMSMDGNKYELQSVCNHFGSIGGGHYTAYGKTQSGWFDYNDSHVSSTSSFQSKDAYLLFYTRTR
ncbi:Oidioi.mRNA.OKI2018_I69.PAR.g13213.t1.cds [Oikopleura dioica]|uniref:Ubiquitin carboxyl-terminal hydrolase n=1 Tax=Oikopleura dioica TaxID=34765 RepID=A0ABN7S492_OIKDI|nr:Oidioi.mRNA.OKI2018_I69.PAR.g13213.t1.cds [Oikopleura dioica]